MAFLDDRIVARRFDHALGAARAEVAGLGVELLLVGGGARSSRRRIHVRRGHDLLPGLVVLSDGFGAGQCLSQRFRVLLVLELLPFFEQQMFVLGKNVERQRDGLIAEAVPVRGEGVREIGDRVEVVRPEGGQHLRFQLQPRVSHLRRNFPREGRLRIVAQPEPVQLVDLVQPDQLRRGGLRVFEIFSFLALSST